MARLRRQTYFSVLRVAALGVALAGGCAVAAVAQEAPSTQATPAEEQGAQVSPAQEQTAQVAEPTPQEPTPVYDKAIFHGPIPAGQLEFLKQFEGAPSNALYRDKRFHKLMKAAIVPGWEFHYGRDMSLPDAVDMAMEGSKVPVQVREGRYVVLGGAKGPYLLGRAMLWIDMQDGLALGAFYFHPTNGEPTPSLTVFSRQIAEDTLSMDRLPPEFGVDLRAWQAEAGVPELATRYFIGNEKRRILLEHDEDFCGYLDGPNDPPSAACEQMNADAADLDMNTAYYLDQVHYATNATAWMITGADETAFIAYRTRSCGGIANPVGCRIRMTREQVHRVAMPRSGGRSGRR